MVVRTTVVIFLLSATIVSGQTSRARQSNERIFTGVVAVGGHLPVGTFAAERSFGFSADLLLLMLPSPRQMPELSLGLIASADFAPASDQSFGDFNIVRGGGVVSFLLGRLHQQRVDLQAGGGLSHTNRLEIQSGLFVTPAVDQIGQWGAIGIAARTAQRGKFGPYANFSLVVNSGKTFGNQAYFRLTAGLTF